jgi:hypothetical protein
MRIFRVTFVAMAEKPRTGAERYLAKHQKHPEYRAAYDGARRRIGMVDALVQALDARREALGITKAELARRADLAPEAVRPRPGAHASSRKGLGIGPIRWHNGQRQGPRACGSEPS